MDGDVHCVYVASGEMEAQQVRAFLETAGIQSIERAETLRHTHGLTVSELGAVEILVPEADAEQARALLAEADAGAFRLADDEGQP